MKLRHSLTIAAISLSVVVGATSALAVDDGTSGPSEATPDASTCDRDRASAEAIASYQIATPGVFFGTLESVDSGSLSQYAVVTGDVADEVTATLTAFGGCIQRDGPAGAYAFLKPGISTPELIFLGVNDVSEETPTAVSSPEGFAPADTVSVFTPQLIVQLPEGRIGAVVKSPQSGADLALLTLVSEDGQWLIEHVTPVSDGDSDGSSGGGP